MCVTSAAEAQSINVTHLCTMYKRERKENEPLKWCAFILIKPADMMLRYDMIQDDAIWYMIHYNKIGYDKKRYVTVQYNVTWYKDA